MNIRELAVMAYERRALKEDLQEAGPISREGDLIFCEIGEILEKQLGEKTAAAITDRILDMVEADTKNSFIEGFEAGMRMASAPEKE